MAIADDQALTIFAAIASSWSAVGTLGWWLSGQFKKTEEKAASALAAHERLDQERHEDTLVNFGRVYVALAKHGYPVVLDDGKLIDPPRG